MASQQSIVAVALLLLYEGSFAQQNTQPPTFRAGINFIRVDVIASDKQGNAVTDFRQQDFDLTEDGKPQTIQTFKLVNITDHSISTTTEPPKPIRAILDEQSEAAREEARLYAVFMDDYHVKLANSGRAREPVARFLEKQLLPTDMVCTMSPLTSLNDVLLTHDRDGVVAAIRTFTGRKFDYRARNIFEERYVHDVSVIEAERIRNRATLSALQGLIVHLGGLRDARKAIILVSEGFTNALPDQGQRSSADGTPISRNSGGGPSFGMTPTETSQELSLKNDMLADIRRVYELANRYNTAIYTVDPRGLAVSEFDLSRGSVSTSAITQNLYAVNEDRRFIDNTMQTLRVLATETDGQAIVNQNDLDAGLRHIVRDSSAYYLLGYTTTENATDGKFHRIDVRVKRPNVVLRARKGYLASTLLEASALAPAKAAPPAALVEALSELAKPAHRLIRTWLGFSPGNNGSTKITFVWEAMPPDSGIRVDSEMASFVALAAAGSSNKEQYFSRLDPAGTPPLARVEFDSSTGALGLEVTVENAARLVIEHEIRRLVVPDFGAELTLATPQVFRAHNAREWQILAADANAIPIPEREFARTERLLVRTLAHGSAGPAAITARLLNRNGAEMFALPVMPSAVVGFSNVDVPLASLAPGDYLVEFKATDDTAQTVALVAIRVTG